ncbi:MAG TPA: class I SAM-dependent methyltransferase [Candidatus Acidoferrum sp.]|nr:class I SAM-dependent methyltransferase [Candidatus Acidoferrum sp.]
MNALENWYCSTSFWRWMTRERLLPWLLGGASLGEQLLEIGAGAGAATAALRKRVPHVVSLEYDRGFATKLAHQNGLGAGVVQGDAAALPFTGRSFSSVIAILALHHLRSSEQQDRAFREIHRVLRPGGQFFAFEIPDGWLHRLVHTRSTFVPVHPQRIAARLRNIGFADVTLDLRPGGFRFRASRNG